MKKEYHYTISRSDRIYLVSFVMLLLGWELIKAVFPNNNSAHTYVPAEKKNTSYTTKYKSYPEKKYKSDYRYNKNYDPKKYTDEPFGEIAPPGHPMDIHVASVNELRSMGLSAKVAYNIQKYIASGGTINDQEDLMRIFGMDSIQLRKALPYILFPARPEKQKTSPHKKDNALSAEEKIIDLNAATTSELESLNGIGKTLGERIVKFREAIGGFADAQQLKDCYGVTPELYDQLKNNLTASGEIKKIHINRDDLLEINHPFLPKKIARIIVAYKKQHGPFQSADDLRHVYPADSNWYMKVLPYLSFENTDEEKK